MGIVLLGGLAVAGMGAMFCYASIKNWDWWFNSAKLKRGPLGGLSRSAQRLFYGIVGSLIILFGLFLATVPFLPESVQRKLL